jgi:Flp pilus assembly pilin Flp
LVKRSPGGIFFEHIRCRAMRLKGVKGQNLVEYTLVVAIVSAAVVAMSTYVFRSVQAKQKDITEEYQKQ